MRRNKIKARNILVFFLVTIILILTSIGCSSYETLTQPSQIPAIQSSQTRRIIIVTGFEPFGEFNTNASWEAVRHLNGVDLDNTHIIVAQLPVVWDKANEKILELINNYKPISIISFGQAGSGPVRLETTAHNVRDNILDNEKMKPRLLQIYQDAPGSLETSLPLDRIKNRLYSNGIPVTVSHDAGRYLCNDIFYTIMYYRSSANTKDLPCGFIHVPPLNAKVSTEEGNILIFDQRQLEKTAKIVIQTIAEMLNNNIASDIPGTELALGSSRSSVVEKVTKPRDVYALKLTAGQEIIINVTDHPGQLNFILATPNSTSFNSNNYTSLFNSLGQFTYNPWSYTLVPTNSDTYYFAVNAWESVSQPYTINVVVTGNRYSAGSIASDIPGTELALGSSRSSVVEKVTKPRDVYALKLTAGQEIKIKVTDHPGQLNFKIAAPSSVSFEDNNYKELFNSMGQFTNSPWSLKYVPAISGTYYFSVTAWESGSQPYTVNVATP